MTKYLISSWCFLLIVISVQCSPLLEAKPESVKKKLLSNDGFRLPVQLMNVEKRDDSDYSYSAEVHKWNSHEAEVDVKKRHARSSGDKLKNMVETSANSYLSYDSPDGDLSDSIEIDDSMEFLPLSPKKSAAPPRKDNKTVVYVHTSKDDENAAEKFQNDDDSMDEAKNFVLSKTRNIKCEEMAEILNQLFAMLEECKSFKEELRHFGKRSLDLFKGVKSLTDVVKNVNPLEEALNSEAIFHGSSKDKNGRSVIKENSKNFLPSRSKRENYARPGGVSDQCPECSNSGIIRTERKRSAEENDDILDMDDPKEITTEATTVSTSNTHHHHHRKGSRKHSKPKVQHENEESDKTLEPSDFSSSSPKQLSDEKETTSKQGTTVISTHATQKPHKSHKETGPNAHSKKNYTSVDKETDHGKKGKKSTLENKGIETTTQSTLDTTQEDGIVLEDDGSQKIKDVHVATIIDGKPKFLKGGSNQRKGLHSNKQPQENPFVDAEGIPTTDEKSKSVQKSLDENVGKIKENIEVGDIKMNIEPGDDKEQIKGPLMIDTKVLVSGSDSKDLFSIGKMKGLLLLGDSQDFVSEVEEKDVLPDKKHGSSDQQEETDDQSGTDEDQQETATGKKGSNKHLKKLLPGGRQRNLFDILSGNIPLIGDGAKDKERNERLDDHEIQSEQHEAQNKTKETGVQQTETARNETANEEIRKIQSSVDNENANPPDYESNLTTTSDKDTSLALQPQGVGIFEPVEAGKSIESFVEGNIDTIATNKTNLLLPSKNSEVPSIPKAPKDVSPEEHFKTFEDAESFFKEVKNMNLTDVFSSEKSVDVTEYSNQQSEKQSDSLQSEDIEVHEKHSVMDAAKETEIIPVAVEEINSDSIVVTDASKPKTDNILSNMNEKGLLHDKTPKLEQDLNKKVEDYGFQKSSTVINETIEPTINDEKHLLEESSVSFGEKALPEEISNLPAVDESFLGEEHDQLVPELPINGDLTEDVIAPETEPKDLIAPIKAKGFKPFGGKSGKARFPERNRFFLPEEKLQPKDEAPIHPLPQMDKGLVPSNDGKGPADTFQGPVDFTPRDQQKDVLPDLTNYGQNQDNGRRSQRLNQQGGSRNRAQLPNSNPGQPNESQRQLDNVDKSKDFLPQTAESRGQAKEFMNKPKNLAGDERVQAPKGSPDVSVAKESNGVPGIGSLTHSKKLQQQHPGSYGFPENYEQYRNMDTRYSNPYENNYYGNGGQNNPNNQRFNRLLNAQDNAPHFMPGFGGFNY